MNAVDENSVTNRPRNDQPIRQIEGHGVGGVFLQMRRTGAMLVLAHEYTGLGRHGLPFTSLRIPFGTGVPGECVRATLNRKMREEVAADPSDFGFEVLSQTPLYWQVASCQQSGERSHLKLAYPAQLDRGVIREFRLVSDAGTTREENLGPLTWFDVGDLLRRMMSEGSPQVHRLAVVSALFWAARRNTTLARCYAAERKYYARALSSFDPFHPVVTDYLSRQ